MLSRKAKVIGISQVRIPTLFHPKIPYYVLVLEDENGNRWVQKSKKEYKIGEEWKEEKEEDKRAVAIWRVKYDILEAIEKVVSLLRGVSLNKNSRILILPTLLVPKHPYFSENTSPDFLEGLINYLLSKGGSPDNIKVVGQSFNEFPIEVSAQKSQLLRICQKYNVKIFDLAKGNFLKKEIDGFSLEISEELFKADLIINLPILKLDKKIGVRGAGENLTRFLKKQSYLAGLYLFSLPELIEKLPPLLPECLTIAEGIKIQRESGFNTFLGLIFGSFTPLHIDRVLAEIVRKKDLPEYLKKIKIENIPIVGREIEELQYDVKEGN